MAYPTCNKVVASIVMDEKKKVVGEFIEHLSQKIEIDDDMNELFDEFLDNMKETDQKNLKVAGRGSRASKKSDDPNKKKRPLSSYNLYMKEMMPIIRQENPGAKNLITLVADSWKNDPRARFIKDKVAEMKEENKDGDIVEFYEKAKAMYAEQETPVQKTKPKSDKDNKSPSDSDNDSDKDNKKPAKKPAKKSTKKASEDSHDSE
jgi:citrate synthase